MIEIEQTFTYKFLSHMGKITSEGIKVILTLPDQSYLSGVGDTKEQALRDLAYTISSKIGFTEWDNFAVAWEKATFAIQKEVLTQASTTHWFKILSRFGKLALCLNDPAHLFPGFYWDVWFGPDRMCSPRKECPIEALRLLADRLTSYTTAWSYDRWIQTLHDYVEENRKAQPLVQREELIGCTSLELHSALRSAIQRCFPEYQPFYKNGNCGYVVGTCWGTSAPSANDMHKFQSLLDAVAADPAYSFRWKAYLERSK